MQAGGGNWRLRLPRPHPIRGESEVHAAGRAAGAGRGAGRGANKSAAGAVRGRGGGGPRRLAGEGASDRARRRGVRCVLALERTQGPSRACSILGALPRCPRPPTLPFRPSAFFSRILSCGGRGVAIRRQVCGFASHAPRLPAQACADGRLLWGPSLFWCRLHPSCALFILSSHLNDIWELFLNFLSGGWGRNWSSWSRGNLVSACGTNWAALEVVENTWWETSRCGRPGARGGGVGVLP